MSRHSGVAHGVAGSCYGLIDFFVRAVGNLAPGLAGRRVVAFNRFTGAGLVFPCQIVGQFAAFYRLCREAAHVVLSPAMQEALCMARCG